MICFNFSPWVFLLFEFLHNLNNITPVEHFKLTVAVENYIKPIYSCAKCPKDDLLRQRKGCRGEVPQRVGEFKVDRCPGNHLQSIDFLLDYYMRWKRGADFSDQPAKLIDIMYFIDNRVEKHKEFLQKEAEKKQKMRGLTRGHSPKYRRKF